MLGVYGGLTLVLRARRAATLQQGHSRVAAPSVSPDHWSAADSDFKLEPSHRQWFNVWAATLSGERCRADDGRRDAGRPAVGQSAAYDSAARATAAPRHFMVSGARAGSSQAHRHPPV